MDWIKKNPDQFTLALASVALIGVSALLFMKAGSFPAQFSEALAAPIKNNQIPAVDTGAIAEAIQQFEKPTTWTPTVDGKGKAVHGGLLFTSESYYIKNGQLEKPGDGALYTDTESLKPIPNQWFLGYGLPLLDPLVPFMDPDGDGFLNQDEWRENTDPTKKESHPPYHTRLFLKQWIRQKFGLKFNSFNGDLAKPQAMEFQIETVDLRQPTEFLKLGDQIPNTPWKLKSFQFKEAINPSTGVEEDASELVLVHAETSEELTLIKNRIVDSPNHFAQFEYRWNVEHTKQGHIFAVPRLRPFGLKPMVDAAKPDPSKLYKLLDVNESRALIQTPDGKEYSVPPAKK
jgi:hypothetical protein